MEPPTIIGLLGAERQSAVSAAQAWPDRPFLLVSDQKVLDGWDLPNCRFRWAAPADPTVLVALPGIEWLPLCPRWILPGLNPPRCVLGAFALSGVLAELRRRFGETVLPVERHTSGAQTVVVKGENRHRPDAPLVGQPTDLAAVEDPHGCGVLYQPYFPWQRLLLATGRRWPNGAVDLGVVAVHGEVCARDDTLGAGETVRHDRVAELTLAMLEHLGHTGFFTCNWLEHGDDARLSSFRPVPRALFGTLRNAGLDLFGPPRADQVRLARPGCKFTIDVHYSSYGTLSA